MNQGKLCVTLVVLIGSLSIQMGNGAASAGEAGGLSVAAIKRGEPVDFATEIEPVLRKNCLACHNQSDAESDVVLESSETMLATESDPKLIVAGSAEESLLFQVASHQLDPVMPPEENDVGAANLTAQELGLLKLWIDQGAHDVDDNVADTDDWRVLNASFQPVYATAVSPDGDYVAAGRGQEVHLYRVGTKRLVGQLSDPDLRDRLPGFTSGTVPPSHLDLVQSLAFSSDGQRLASGGYRVAKMWRRPTPRLVDEIGQVDQPTGALSAIGHMVAVGSDDGVIHLFDTNDMKRVRQWQGHDGPVSGLAFTPNGSRLASVSHDSTCRVWQIDGETPSLVLHASSPLEAVTWDAHGSSLVVAGADNVIRCWNSPSAAHRTKEVENQDLAELTQWKGHRGKITALVPLDTEPSRIVSCSLDGTVRIWDVASGQQAHLIDNGGPVLSVAADSDGTRVAVAGDRVRLWNVHDGQLIAEHRGDHTLGQRAARARRTAGIRKQLAEAAERDLHATEKQVTDDENELGSAAAETEKAEEELKRKTEAASGEQASEEAVKAKEAAQRALEASRERAIRRRAALQHAEAAVGSARAALEKARLAADNAQAQLAEVRKLASEGERPFVAIAWSAECQLFTVVSDDGKLHCFDATSGEPICVSSKQSSSFANVASLGGSELIALDVEGRLGRWSVSQNWTLERVIGADFDGRSPADRVTALAFSPDGRLLATGGGEPSRVGELMLWEVDNGRHMLTVDTEHSDNILSLAFSPDGNYLASASADRTVKVHDVKNGRLVRTLEGHMHHVLSVSWRADARRLASGGADRVVKVWEIPSGDQVKTMEGFGKEVIAVQFLGQSDSFVVGSASGQLTTKTTSGGGGTNYGGASGFLHSAAVSDEGNLIAAGGEQGVVWVWARDGKTLASLPPPDGD